MNMRKRVPKGSQIAPKIDPERQKVASETMFGKGLEKETKKSPLNLENDVPVDTGALFSLFLLAQKEPK